MQYKKPPITIQEQVDLLKKRGLIVPDECKLERYLKDISYYHLSIYFKHFQKGDIFLEGTTFDDVLNIYTFDKKLRLILLDVLERIEKSFKCRMAHEVAIAYGDPYWLSDERYFDDKVNYRKITTQILKKNVKMSKEICIKHFYAQYRSQEYPPIWMIVETLTFGQCVLIYRQLRKGDQKRIADTYGINKRFIANWMYALSTIRNTCAHHTRLWNKEMVIALTKKHGLYKNYFHTEQPKRLFNYLVVIQIINSTFNPTSQWDTRLAKIISEHNINVSHMGFPENWEERLRLVRGVARNSGKSGVESEVDLDKR